MNNIKNNFNEENNKKTFDITNITLLSTITSDSYTCFFNYTFIEFKTIDNLYYLVYTSKDNSIICFDLNKNQKIAEIKQINKEIIAAFRHYSDLNQKKDFVMTFSPINDNLRLWDSQNWQCILYINKTHKEGILYSACFLNENNNNYIVVSNCNYFGDSELIKIFDFKGNKTKETNDSNDATLLVDIYYDKKNLKKYIVTANKNYLKTFDYNKNKSYHKYYEE